MDRQISRNLLYVDPGDPGWGLFASAPARKKIGKEKGNLAQSFPAGKLRGSKVIPFGHPNGIRTRVAGLKGWSPGLGWT